MRFLRATILAIAFMGFATACGGSKKEAAEPTDPAVSEGAPCGEAAGAPCGEEGAADPCAGGEEGAADPCAGGDEGAEE